MHHKQYKIINKFIVTIKYFTQPFHIPRFVVCFSYSPCCPFVFYVFSDIFQLFYMTTFFLDCTHVVALFCTSSKSVFLPEAFIVVFSLFFCYPGTFILIQPFLSTHSCIYMTLFILDGLFTQTLWTCGSWST